jgi:hypothetical protein
LIEFPDRARPDALAVVQGFLYYAAARSAPGNTGTAGWIRCFRSDPARSQVPEFSRQVQQAGKSVVLRT